MDVAAALRERCECCCVVLRRWCSMCRAQRVDSDEKFLRDAGRSDLTLFMWLVCSEFSVHLARDLPAGARGDSPVLLRWVRQAR